MGEQQEFSPYEKLAILREEMDQRNKELTALERQINSIREIMSRRKYLWSLYPEFYKEMPPPEGARELPGLLERRRTLTTLVERLNGERASLEANMRSAQAAAPQQPQQSSPQRPQQQRRARFASFDDFSQQQRST
ncbi:MAG TPA: hypothetical protein ENN09_07330 [Planctomycetes bacterium]|nr:hypothetical protein [Planctomycetota bacterium]